MTENPGSILDFLRLPNQRRALLREAARSAATAGDMWATFEAIGYEPHQRQREFHQAGLDGCDRRVFLAGRRSGKTTAAAMEAIYRLLRGDEDGRGANRVLVVCPVYELTERLWRVVYDLIIRQLRFEPRRMSDSATRREIVMPWHSVLVCRSAEGRALDSIIGDSFDLAILDEASRLPGSAWEVDIEPCLLDREGHALFPTTPRFGWLRPLWERCESDEWPDWFGVHCSSAENPHISRRWLHQRRRSTSREAYLREYEAEWVQLDGLVYQEFRPEDHVTDAAELDPRLPVDLCFDFGTTEASPFVALVCQRSGEALHVCNELRIENRSTLGCAERLLEWWLQNRYPRGETASSIGDIAARDSRLVLEQTLRGEGILASGRVATMKQLVEPGIERIRNLLRENRLIIHPRCRGLIEEFTSYTWRQPPRDGEPEPGPRKSFDHGLDALRYLVTYLEQPAQCMTWATRQSARERGRARGFAASALTENERSAVRRYTKDLGLDPHAALLQYRTHQRFREARKAANEMTTRPTNAGSRRGRIK